MGEGKREAGYGFGPFRFESEIGLTDLRLPRVEAGKVVEIRLGEVRMETLGDACVDPWVRAGEHSCGLVVPGLGSFAVSGGDRVVVDLEPGADLGDVRGYLTAWVFGALCHQNGMLPLHASAVERGGLATAFPGHSGAGKSTLAAFLGRRGDRVLADDICLLREDQEAMRIVPVAEWLKLWPATMEALGEPIEARDRTYSDEEKYRVYRTGAARADAAAGLRHVVFVERGEGAARLERVSAAEALGRMMGLVYLGYCLEAMGLEARVFRQCGRVLAGAEAWVLTAPWGFGQMEAVMDLLGETVLGQQRADSSAVTTKG